MNDKYHYEIDENLDAYWQHESTEGKHDIPMNRSSSASRSPKTLTENEISDKFRKDLNEYTNDQKPTDTNDIDFILAQLSSKYGSKVDNSGTSKNSLISNSSLETKKAKYTEESAYQNIKAMQDIETVFISDSEFSDEPDFKRAAKSSKNTPRETKFSNFSDSYDSDEPDEKVSKKVATKTIKMTKEEKVVARKAAQEAKRIQRDLKKAEDLKNKEMKKLIAQATKELKPEDYLRQMEVILDESLTDKTFTKEILNTLQEYEIRYSTESHLYSNSVTWKRKVQSHVFNDDRVVSKISIEESEVVLFILECDDFVAMMDNNELLSYFQTVQEVLPKKIITIGLYGVNDYLRLGKNQKKRGMKSAVLNTVNKRLSDIFVDRSTIEANLTKLQIFLSICYRHLDTAHDVAALVNQMTKSISQTPYKLKKLEQMEQAENYMVGDNKDCVLVDKNGNGLSRLWQQHITAFPLVRLDLAESVMATYPTFSSLMQAYEKSSDDNEREKLLENLEIRRAAGPLTNFRKVGPEFSKKMFKYYNCREGDLLL